MIIFDLDGTLANCEHRRHFVDYTKIKTSYGSQAIRYHGVNEGNCNSPGYFYHEETKEKWKPNWPAFYEACDKDEPIEPVLSAFIHLTQGEPFNHDVQIWSGRCESVRKKTLKWFVNLTGYCEDYEYWDRRLKMRPIGDNTPDYMLKEMWLNQACKDQFSFQETGEKFPCKHNINFVFTSDPKEIEMWQRRGIFVFNCCQHDGEF